VEFNSVAVLGTTVNVYDAYGAGPAPAAQVMGFTSNSNSTTSGQYSVSGCSDKVINPANVVDNDPNNYASFGSLLTLNCNPQLQVSLTGTAPGSYKAGFVIGQASCIVPGDGEGFFSRIFQANLWEKYHMAAPRQRRQLGALSSKVQKAYKR